MTHRVTRVILAALLLAPLSTGGAATPTPSAGPTISRDAVAQSVENREPVGMSETFPASVGSLVYFTEVKEIRETMTLTHVWSHKGQVMAEISLKVEPPSWRTWSSKRILPEWTGEWKVEVKSADGTVLASKSFTIK